VAQRRRLDAELVRRKLARSREHASELVQAGRVSVAGSVATKPATQVDPAVAIVLARPTTTPDYASRGGHKLAGALDHFASHGGLTVEHRRALDAGASTGGFTDVSCGAARRTSSPSTSATASSPGTCGRTPGSRSSSAPTSATSSPGRSPRRRTWSSPTSRSSASASSSRPWPRPAAERADHVLMVKPQFEVGRERLGSGGVVRDPGARRQAVADVAHAAHELGLGTRGVVASPLPGPSGNVEYFLWLHREDSPLDDAALARAVAEGPQ
jgi:23S rRNA (cytidine1920-2'-O)/16S rRNA (cytidine1409-2'-O)-methyltransferase